MKKTLSVLFALLLVVSIAGVVYSHQGSYNPQTNDGGAYITVPVYNNSGGTLDAGDVVVWDVDASTGDNDAYVTTTTTAETGIVAGVIWPSSILANTSGAMAIWGIVECDAYGGGFGEASPLCSSGTAGAAKPCLSTTGSGSFAVSNAAVSGSAQGSCTVK